MENVYEKNDRGWRIVEKNKKMVWLGIATQIWPERPRHDSQIQREKVGRGNERGSRGNQSVQGSGRVNKSSVGDSTTWQIRWGKKLPCEHRMEGTS